MKISKIFHWLYLSLLVLPIVTIPVFMIYSHRHDLTQRTEVDIQYKYQSNEVNNWNDIVLGNIYYTDLLTCGDDGNDYIIDILSYDTITELQDFDISQINSWNSYDSRYNNALRVRFSNNVYYLSFTNTSGGYTILECPLSAYLEFTNLNFVVVSNLQGYLYASEGYGNPLPQYTDYNVIESVSVNDIESDIMSQFTNSLYNTTEKYYNFDNFFALGEIRQWFNTNFFNGNPSLGFGIAWHLLTYWFVVSIFWLIFDVLMYLPLLVHRWLDKGAIA